MKAEELTKEIYDKCPKVWETLKSYMFSYKLESVNNEGKYEFMFMFEPFIGFLIYDPYELDQIKIPFSMLYGLLEDFFEEKGIDIQIYKTRDVYDESGENIIKKGGWTYDFPQDDGWIFKSFWGEYETKNKAKYEAILKACEIREERLLNKN